MGARVAKMLAVAAIVWDLLCAPGDTISEVLATWLVDKRTRGPLLFAAAVLVAHVVLIARRIHTEEHSGWDLQPDAYQETARANYPDLRWVGFPA